MTSARFLYTSQPGKGFEEFVSPEQQLTHRLRDNLRQPSSGNIRFFDVGLGVTLQDGMVICTYLSKQLDDNKRPFARNHSVLLTEADYSQMAKDFKSSILAQIEEEDADIAGENGLKPLNLPKRTSNGLSGEELATLAANLGQNLEQLLALLISGKAFSIRLRGTQEEGIALAMTLLKIAALGSLPVPQISTFEPNARTRAWYPSQIATSPSARLPILFQPKDSPGKAAAEQAERLARAVENHDPDGIAHAMRIGRNHSQVIEQLSVKPKAPTPIKEGRTLDVPTPTNSERNSKEAQARTNEIEPYQYNKDFEKKLQKLLDIERGELSKQREELDSRRKELEKQEDRFLEREYKVRQREKDVESEEDQLRENKVKNEQWQHIYEICRVLDQKGLGDLEKDVLSRFFEALKGLSADTLQTLDEGIKGFIPNLEKIAKKHPARRIGLQRVDFSQDVSDIEKTIKRKS